MTNAMIAFSILAVLLAALAASAFGLVCFLTRPAKFPARKDTTKSFGSARGEDGNISDVAKTTLPISDLDDELDELRKRSQKARESGADTPLRAFLRDLMIRELIEADRKPIDSFSAHRDRAQAS